MNEPDGTLYWLWEEAVDPDFCKYLLSKIEWDKHHDAKISGNILNKRTRKTDVVWAPPNSPLGATLCSFASSANISANWNFNIGQPEPVQIARYANKGHYSWHQDIFAPSQAPQRKLSVVLLLNDATEFEGGKLEIQGMPQFPGLHKAGSLIVFPSFVTHRVTPVTKGVRYTAVCWMLGNPFV